jgi:hypothetical protein
MFSSPHNELSLLVPSARQSAKQCSRQRLTLRTKVRIWPGFFLLLISLLMSGTPTAAAHLGASIHRTSGISTAEWAVIAYGENQPVIARPYILIWSVKGGTALDYFFFRNSGSTFIRSFRVEITQIRLTGNARAPEIFFEQCLGGVWNSTTDQCSGTVLLVGRASDSQFTMTNLNLVSSAQLSFRSRTAPNNQSTFETTLSVHVARSDAQIAEVRNS